MKTAVIDTGGGLRGIYGAGVFDFCLENKISFSHCIGVSAGSANTASFLAGQKERNFRFYTEYAKRREYMSSFNFLKTHSYLNLDYIYGTLSNSTGEDPLDCETLLNNPSDYTVVATDAKTGEPKYFTKDDISTDNYAILKASCCIPAINQAYTIGDRLYYDGGVGDAIPIDYALKNGAEKIVLILTRPVDSDISFNKERLCAALLRSDFPNTSKALLEREKKYREAIKGADALRRKGKLLIVAPSDIGNLKTLSKDTRELSKLYIQGKTDAEKILHFL